MGAEGHMPHPRRGREISCPAERKGVGAQIELCNRLANDGILNPL